MVTGRKEDKFVFQRERLSLWDPKGYAIVQTTEETCRGESEAIFPPSDWSVGLVRPKVIEWLRSTAGCQFYQGEDTTLALYKSSLMDLDTYVTQEAA